MVAEYPTDEGIVNTLKKKTDSGSDDDVKEAVPIPPPA